MHILIGQEEKNLGTDIFL